MFNLFKRNKPLHKLPISEAIVKLQKKGAKNLHINLSINDEILFQVMPAKHFEENGFDCKHSDFAIVHFFTKQKINQFKNTFNNFKGSKELFYYEKPKNNHIFLQNIGNNPSIIESKIKEAIDEYHLD